MSVDRSLPASAVAQHASGASNGEADAGKPVGIVIPAHQEEASIARCLRALQHGLPPGFARIVVVCNGCSDRTAEIARAESGPDVVVLELAEAGKAAAIRRAEASLASGTRVFLDADCEISGQEIVQLVRVLGARALHLVSPRIEHDRTGCGWAAAAVSRTWLALPHADRTAFHHVLVVSAAGRSRWGVFPDVVGDDAFIAARFHPNERAIVDQARVRVRPPRTLGAWIGVRARWLQGASELRAAGLHESPSTTARQGPALLRMCLSPVQLPGVLLYLWVRIAAGLRLRLRGKDGKSWFRDATSRT